MSYENEKWIEKGMAIGNVMGREIQISKVRTKTSTSE
jgi:hypothetical protein